MKDNILKELDDPQDQQRNMEIVTPNFFERNQTTKRIRQIETVKRYELDFDKRVIYRTTRVSYPYGYNWFDDDVELSLSL